MAGINSNWHTNKAPRRKVTGSVDASCSGTWLSCSCSITQSQTAYGHSDFSDNIRLCVDGSAVSSASIPMVGTNSRSLSWSGNVSVGGHTVSVQMQCGDSACPVGKYNNPVTVGSVWVEASNPYGEPTVYSVTPTTQIGRVDVTNYGLNYTITLGNLGSLDWVDGEIYPYSTTWNYGKWNNVSGISGSRKDKFSLSGGSGSYKLQTPNFSSGERYRLAIHFSDCHYEWISGDDKIIYTYQEPKIKNILSIARTQPQNAISDNKFTISETNNRMWTSFENEFQTRYRIKLDSDNSSSSWSNWTNIDNVTEWSRTSAQMRSLIPKAYDNKNCKIQFKRYSPSAPDSNGNNNGWYSTNTAEGTLKLYYRPRQLVTSTNTSYKLNNSSGGGLNKNQVVTNTSSVTGIYVSWLYDTNAVNAGYTQGYRLRLYNAAGTVVKTYYTTNKSYTIPKADIPKIQHTYLDITPYYGNDQSNLADAIKASNYWYYNAGAITKFDFIILTSNLDKPTITYPVNNSSWINNKFRVCFQLPSDPDKGSETATETTYHYENIEININGTKIIRLKDSQGTSSGSVLYEACCSSLVSDLTYQKKIVMYPGMVSGFPNTNTYTIKVRVKKKYGVDNLQPKWSDWSNTVTVKIKPTNYSVKKDDLILASHYNTLKDYVTNSCNTYSSTWSTSPSNVTSKNTIIKNEQYKYDIFLKQINNIKNVVNNYASFNSSRNTVKFDSTDEIPTTFNQQVEIITADENLTNNPNGRNYIAIAYDYLNKLL